MSDHSREDHQDPAQSTPASAEASDTQRPFALPPPGDPYYATPEACKPLHKTYETCFMQWYREVFLPGEGSVREVGCQPEFEAYNQCIRLKLQAHGYPLEELEKNFHPENRNNTPAASETG
mmetsp:Transcript_22309/g.55995  ORF Transcript_22309/g.55995 Transcript_22309/m.55995 type:complete len:121 (+) Transcript_22309:69-431(+)